MIAVNPFVPPGDDPHSDGPLDPELHAGWFIDDVGDHGVRLAEFTQQLHVPGIARRGRLVVVEGPDGSGKTTLVNRCVELVRAHVPRGMVLSTLDLRSVSPTKTDGALRSGHELRWTVCRHALEEASWLTDEQRGRGADMLERPSVEDCDPGLVYRFMRKNLGADRIAVVLLPTAPPEIDAPNLETYDGWMGPGMLFFAERTTTPGSVPLARRPPRPDSLPLLSLPLRHLEPGEAWRVVERRLGGLPAGSGLPGVTEETLRKVEGLNRDDQHTIGWVVGLFRRLYARRIGGRSEFDGLPFIDFPEITDLLARREPEAP